MSYNTDLQNNNTFLQEILATVNALPEAGGSEIETCTIEIWNYAAFPATFAICSTYKDGVINIENILNDYSNSITLENVIVNSFLIIHQSGGDFRIGTLSPFLSPIYTNTNNDLHVFKIPSNGGIIQINLI